ncbi:MAG TPA: type II toxin-antitoxin system VapC family toxin [Azospirillum sp.]|nr:type II toxin-antitoxin system VapC family toxin [Azospirillum sp.]
MILLDTNVVSETMRAAPEPRVVAWLDAQLVETLHLSAVSLAELLLGIAVLPDGKRKVQLGIDLTTRAAGLFGERVLPFDARAASAYADVVSRARAGGRAIGVADGQIAAIAAARGLIVATRDVAPFEAAGVPVVNPWTASNN